MEAWKDVDGYEGIYQVSDCGNVRSIDRRGIDGRIICGRKISFSIRKDGYCIVGLYKNRKRKMFYVHRLVCNAFVENPNSFLEINHKDEIKSNNNSSNLEWCNRSYNNTYGRRIEKIMASPG